jgi:hypothetical protein
MESSSQGSSALYDESKQDAGSGGSKSFELGRTSEAEFSSDKSKEFSSDKSNSRNSLDLKRRKSTIGSKETRLVKISKYVVLTFMVIACTACAMVVYVVSSNAQEDSFVQQVGNAEGHVLVF